MNAEYDTKKIKEEIKKSIFSKLGKDYTVGKDNTLN